jgi:pre-rRNA-processing protein TSR4
VAALSIEPATATSLAAPHPAYWPAQYLSTTDEYLPPPEQVDYDSDHDKDESAEQKAEWRDERFQQMLTKGIDPLFERFVRRLADAEGAAEQVLRCVHLMLVPAE